MHSMSHTSWCQHICILMLPLTSLDISTREKFLLRTSTVDTESSNNSTLRDQMVRFILLRLFPATLPIKTPHPVCILVLNPPFFTSAYMSVYSGGATMTNRCTTTNGWRTTTTSSKQLIYRHSNVTLCLRYSPDDEEHSDGQSQIIGLIIKQVADYSVVPFR